MKIEIFGSWETDYYPDIPKIYVIGARCEERCHQFRKIVLEDDMDLIRSIDTFWTHMLKTIDYAFDKIHPCEFHYDWPHDNELCKKCGRPKSRHAGLI